MTSFQVRQGVPFFLICGLFAEPDRQSVQEDLRAILWKAAAITHRWPLYCYLCANAYVTVPGIATTKAALAGANAITDAFRH